MTQLEIAQKIELCSRRLCILMDSTSRAHNIEKQILVDDIKRLAEMLRFTK